MTGTKGISPMLHPSEINPLYLESYSYGFRQLLPSAPGLYFVINCKNELLYIGAAENIKERWTKHPHKRVPQLLTYEGIRVAWLLVENSGLDDLRDIEESYILHFRQRCPMLLNNTRIPHLDKLKEPNFYKKDFLKWSDRQTIFLRARKFNRLDVVNLVKEVGKYKNNNRCYPELLKNLKIGRFDLLKDYDFYLLEEALDALHDDFFYFVERKLTRILLKDSKSLKLKLYYFVEQE